MIYLCIIIVFVVSHETQSTIFNKTDTFSLLKSNSTSEQKVWNIKLDIYFAKTLPNVLQKVPGSDVRFKCEAMMNFTKVERFTKSKERIETSLKEFPPDHIQEALMKNVKVFWLKNNKILTDTPRIKIITKIDKANGTIGTHLKIKNLNISDAGNYTCAIKQNYEKKLSTRLIIQNNVDLFEDIDTPTYTPVFSSAGNDKEFVINIRTTPDLIYEGMISENEKNLNHSVLPQKLEPICQEYVGKVCSPHLKGQFVYIPYDTSQNALEDKLLKAFQVTKYSNDISSNCERYALPSLCYSTFPICRNPILINKNYFKEAKDIFNNLLSKEQINERLNNNLTKIAIENDSIIVPFKLNKNITGDLFNYRYNSTILRRVCKQDCEILENELCQTEYAIAKRHPHIGKQLTLEECQDLPESDPDCLKIGIESLMVSDDECYWENGSGYLGKVSEASNGMPCIEWSKQLSVKVAEFPELTGRHSYCRNPGGVKSQPWCYIENDGRTEHLCDIPKCAHKIWIYIVVIFLLLSVVIIAFIICLFYRHKNKGNAATIRDINLPNADKNIYGNSRLNSPIEMNELLTIQNGGSQPHLNSTARGTGILRIPQYSLSQIKFLEELGEGAFGKVYKGALKKNGETLYVAVKALKENASAKTKADFRREIDLISELTHDNIVCIVGVALKEEPLCMLFEFMARGDLHEFLMGRAPPSGKGLPSMRLLNIAYNIASGMQYLASHHYVHRDLAARNCLVSDDFIVKISDFGLSRDIYSSDYYRVSTFKHQFFLNCTYKT